MTRPRPDRPAAAAPDAAPEVSEVSLDAPVDTSAVREELERARTARAAQVRDALAPSTRVAYARDWRHFAAWCTRMATVEPALRALPSDDNTLSLWVGSMEALAPATVRRRLAAVKLAHERHGLALLDEALPATVAALRGHRRRQRAAGTKARAPGRERAATDTLVQAMVDGCDAHTPIGRRNRALLLLGWDAALRRGELVGIDLEHLAPDADGLVLTLPFAKGDQEGVEATVFVRRRPDSPYCPVRAVRDWCAMSGRGTGPLFVSLHPGRHTPVAGTARLSAGAIGRIVSAAAARAGLDSAFSGHSLRRGLITTTLESGVPITRVMQHARHRSVETTAGYAERRDARSNHPDVDLHSDPVRVALADRLEALPAHGPLALPAPLELLTWQRRRPLLPGRVDFEYHFGDAPALSHNTLMRVQRDLHDGATPGTGRSERAFVDFMDRQLDHPHLACLAERLSDPATCPSSRRAASLLGYLRARSHAFDDPPSYALCVGVELIDEDTALARGDARDRLVHAPRLLLAEDVVGVPVADAWRAADTALYLRAAHQAELGRWLAGRGIDPAPFDAFYASPYEHGILQERFFAHLCTIAGDPSGAIFADNDPDGARAASLAREMRYWRARNGERNLSRENLARMLGAGLPAQLRADDGVEFWTMILWEQYEALLAVRTMLESSTLSEARIGALLERFVDHLAHQRADLDTWVPRPAFER